MRKTVARAMTAGLLLLLCVIPAHAAPVTVHLYLRVDSVNPRNPDWQEFVHVSLPYVGQRFPAGAIYDDANVPASGAYTIGHFYPGYECQPLADELQEGAYAGFYSPIGVNPAMDPTALSSGIIIELMNGRFSGINILDSVDTYSLNRQSLKGTHYSADGWYLRPGYEGLSIEAEWSVSGTLHVVPDPGSTLLLLGLGVVGLGAWRKRWQ